jgi:hypothetical protein
MARPWPVLAKSTAIVGSPAAAAETIVCQVGGLNTDGPTQSIYLEGWMAFTVGTTGTAVTLRLRQTGLAGAVVVTSGALTGGIAAANLVALGIQGADTPGEVDNFVYVLTMQVTGGSAISTVSSTNLFATITN